MPKRFLLFVLAVVLSLASALAHPSSAPQRSRSSSSSKSNKSSSDKTVHVNGYYRKDGTYVHSHDRRQPGSKSSASDAGTSLQKLPAPGAVPPTVSRDSNGRIKRSEAAKEEFERQTGYPHGRRGYVVDHIKPLACGGADDPSNMQWQTVAEAKAKDKTERLGCK